MEPWIKGLQMFVGPRRSRPFLCQGQLEGGATRLTQGRFRFGV